MKALCTSYTQTDKGLVLRSNWIDEIRDLYHLNDYLDNFIDRDHNDYITNDIRRQAEKGIFTMSNIIEGEMDLDNVVIHIRIVL